MFQIFICLLFFNLFSSPSTAEECKYDNLPQDLNTAGYLEYNYEMHIQGKYRANFSQDIPPISFVLSSESYVRMYVAPHEVDIDLELFSNQGLQMTSQGEIETMVFGILKPSTHYRLMMTHHAHAEKHGDCTTVTVEFAIVPVSVESKRAQELISSNFCANGTDSLPTTYQINGGVKDIVIFNSAKQNFHFYIASRSALEEDSPSNVELLKFHVPTSIGRQNLWSFKGTIRTDFLSSGSVGLAVSPASLGVLTRECIESGDCITGIPFSMNSKSIRELLGPGNYTLWIYDLLEFRDPSLVPCSPFDLEIEILQVDEIEDFVNCVATRLPTNLNAPGLLEDGYLDFSESVFLDVGQTYDVEFELKTESYFRAFVEEHKVDIDLQLLKREKGGSKVMMKFSNRYHEEDAIQSYLEEGQYVLTYKFYISQSLDFCETFETRIAIYPAPHNDAYCLSSDPRHDPDLRLLHKIDAKTPTFELERQSSSNAYFFPYEDNYDPRPFIEKSFYVEFRSRVEVIAYANFLFGDLTLSLIAVAANGNTTVWGDHKRNRVELVEVVEPGNYVLMIGTGARENRVMGSDDYPVEHYFPSCIKYEMEIHIASEVMIILDSSDPTGSSSRKRSNPVYDAGCPPHRRLPEDLMGVEFLGVAYQFHIQESFRISFDQGLLDQHSTYFSSSEDEAQMFRLFSEPHFHDVDFRLYQTVGDREALVASSIGILTEEKMSVLLSKGTQYRLEVSVIKYPGHENQPCQFYNLEMAVYPALLGDPVVGCDSSSPDPNILQDAHLPWSGIQGSYSFAQSEKAFNAEITFGTTQPIYFSASAFYDFQWNDLYFILYKIEGDENIEFQTGKNKFNRNLLEPVLLEPGSYVLALKEPALMKLEFRRCAHYTVQISGKIALADEKENIDKEVLLGCEDEVLPFSWNTEGFLTPLTGYQLHIQENILVDSSVFKEIVDFQLNTESIFRVYIPPHPYLDIDIRLSHGSTQFPGSVIEAGTSIGEEESILQILDVGEYIFQINFYQLTGSSSFAGSDECASFPIEVSIVPRTYVTSNGPLTHSCSSGGLALGINNRVQYATKFPVISNQKFHTSFEEFTVKETSYINFEVEFDFLSSDVQLLLAGNLDSGRNISYVGTIHENSRVIDEILVAGNYTMQIYDPSTKSDGSIDEVRCLSLYLNYLIQLDGNPPLYICDHSQIFPVDSYSSEGGSIGYGGTQLSSTGEVWIKGDRFPIPAAGSRLPFRFLIKKKSHVRASVWGENRELIELLLFENERKDIISEASKLANAEGYPVESSFFILDPKESVVDPFLLELNFRSVEEKTRCPSFAFNFVIRAVEDTKSFMECPYPMPSIELPLDSSNPPQFLHIDEAMSITYVSTMYVLTKERAAYGVEGGYYVHTLTISSSTPWVAAVAKAQFDFVSTDIYMKYRVGNHIKGQSMPFIMKNTRGGFNFESTLEFMVGVEDVQLDIYISISQYESMFSKNESWCVPFDFSLYVSAENAQHYPSVIDIDPPSANDLNPFTDFYVSIDFSEEIVEPDSSVINEEVINSRLVYLVPEDRHPPIILPIDVKHNELNNRLELQFPHDDFKSLLHYNLQIESHKMIGVSGNPFSPIGPLGYTIGGCACSGHGKCDVNFDDGTVCECFNSFAPPHCSECLDDHHQLGYICAENTHCGPETCLAEQPCEEIGGVATCMCSKAYDGIQCEKCAEGYDGFPDCVPVDMLGGGRPPGCTAPLLPTSLNSLGYIGSDHGSGSGSLHLQDRYFIPPANTNWESHHEMSFQIEANSVFRLSMTTDSGMAFANIYLYLSTVEHGNKTLKLITNGTSASHEKIIAEELPKLQDHQQYQVNFHFTRASDGDVISGLCETVNLELEMMPVVMLQGLLLDVEPKVCQGNKLPLKEKRFDKHPFNVQPGSKVSYPGGSRKPTFSVERSSFESFHIFHTWEFQTGTPKSLQIPHLVAEVGHRFVTGQVALALAPEGATCGQSCDCSCVLGEAVMNRNILDVHLEPGKNYTLYFYEPVPQMSVSYGGSEQPITACAPFDFSMTIDWVPNPVVRCDSPLPPPTLFPLKEPGAPLLNHLTAKYYLLEAHMMTFSLTERSAFRIGVQSEFDLSLSLYNKSGASIATLPLPANSPDSLFQILDSGDYSVKISSLAGARSDEDCPTFTVEAARLPENSLPNITCTGPSQIIPFQQLPFFYFGERIPFYEPLPKDHDAPIWEFNFTLREEAMFGFELLHDFLMTDLRTKLVSVDVDTGEPQNNRVIVNEFGGYSYNHLYDNVRLTPGKYSLEVVAPEDVYGRMTCVQFSFVLEIYPVSFQLWGDDCPDGQKVPVYFDSLRFAGPTEESSFHYYADNYQIPFFNEAVTNTYVSFETPPDDPSLFRVFVDFLEIDIDLELFDMTDPRNIIKITTGDEGGEKNGDTVENLEGLYPGETLLIILDPSKRYRLNIIFNNAVEQPIECRTFPMETALVVIDKGPLELCPKGGVDQWGKTSIEKSVQYPDVYFQQHLGERQSHKYSIVRTDEFSLYAEANFDFVTGHLMMIFEGPHVHYISTNSLNAATLSASRVPPGHYTLEIREMSQNLQSRIQCVHFSLTVETQMTEVSISSLKTLPPTLNRLSFLDYNDEVNLQTPITLPVGVTDVLLKPSVNSNLKCVIYAKSDTFDEVSLALSDPKTTAHSTSYDINGFNYFLLEAELTGGKQYKLHYNVKATEKDREKDDVLNGFTALSVVQNDHFAGRPMCEDSHPVLPSVVIDETWKSFTWSASNIKMGMTDDSDRVVVHEFYLNITEISKLFATVGFSFPLDEFFMELYLGGEGDEYMLLTMSTRSFDESSIDEILDVGEYRLILYAMQVSGPWEVHCAEFDFFISIHDVASDYSLCSGLNSLPTSLDTDYFVTPYGIPQQNGYLHLSYDRFYIDNIPGTFETVITVDTPSYLSIFAHSASVASVENFVLNHNGKRLYDLISHGEPESALTVTSLKPGEHVIKILLDDKTTHTECLNYGADIKLMSHSLLKNEVRCDSSTQALPWALHNTFELPIGESHIGSSTVNGFFSPIDLLEVHQITFKPTASSSLSTSIGFDSLLSSWEMVLYRTDGEDAEMAVQTSRLQSFSETSSQANLRSSLSAPLEEGGEYLLEFIRFPVHKDLDLEKTCEPFLWDIFILPIYTDRPVVSQVEPANLLSFKTEADGFFRLSIDFTEELYLENGTSVKPHDVARAFSLRTDDEILSPLFAEGGGRFWVLTFASEFTPNRDFMLSLEDGILFDYNQDALALATAHHYVTMDSECGLHGIEFEEGLCLCAKGFAGRDCNACDSGYKARRTKSGGLVCKAYGGVAESIAYQMGLFLAFTVLIINIGSFVYLHLKSSKSDPFRTAFSWDHETEEDPTSLLDEDADAELLSDLSGGKRGGSVFEGGDEDEDEDEDVISIFGGDGDGGVDDPRMSGGDSDDFELTTSGDDML